MSCESDVHGSWLTQRGVDTTDTTDTTEWWVRRLSFFIFPSSSVGSPSLFSPAAARVARGSNGGNDPPNHPVRRKKEEEGRMKNEE